jgi:hypothetical protein
MEPLVARGGFGTVNSSDYKLFRDNKELYEELSARGETLIAEALAAYLGEGMKNDPLPTEKELEADLEKYLTNVKLTATFGAPIQELYSNLVRETAQKLTNKEYCRTEEQKSYRRAYDKRWESFFKSKLYVDLYEEIYEFNVAKADEWYQKLNA